MSDTKHPHTESEMVALEATVIDGECDLLCRRLTEIADELQAIRGHTPADEAARRKLIAELRAIRAHMRSLHCKLCFPH